MSRSSNGSKTKRLPVYVWFIIAGYFLFQFLFAWKWMSFVFSSMEKVSNQTSGQAKAAHYFKVSCLEEEKREKIDLQCDNVFARVDEKPVWTEEEGIDTPRKTGTFAWTTRGWTYDASNRFTLVIDLRVSRDGKLLHYNRMYADGEGKLKVRPRDYPQPETAPKELFPEPKETVTEPAPTEETQLQDAQSDLFFGEPTYLRVD